MKGNDKMVAWYWILVAILVTNAVTSFTYEYFDWENGWTEFLSWLCLIVIYVPLVIYHICFKNIVDPFSPAQFEKIKAMGDRCNLRHLFKGIYFCTDRKASMFWNKFFFLRVK